MSTRGRRPGSPGTAEAILRAARERFAEGGFDRTTIRAIAQAAGVDAALVLHHFGSKDALFARCVDLPVDPATLEAALAGPTDGVGTRVARLYLSLWEAPETGPALLAALRSTAAHPGATDLMREFVARQILARLRPHVAPDRPELRATLAGSHLIGTAFARYLVAVEPLASTPLETVVTAVGPQVEHYLVGEIDWAPEEPGGPA